MRIEELKQLEEDVCAWWVAWTAYKCETSDRQLYSAISLRHVQALIDAEIECQSVRDADVKNAIASLRYCIDKSKTGNLICPTASTVNLAIAVIRQMRTGVDCKTAEWTGGKCCGYGKAENDDEPIDSCKTCPKQASFGIE